MLDTSAFEISPRALGKRLGDVTLIDVREHSEVGHGALPGAHHIPMGAIVENVGSHPALKDRDREIVVYCAHGIRSAAVVRYLREQGFRRALNLAGGLAEWEMGAHRRTRHGAR